MSNGYNVEWSELAVNDFNEIIQYLSKHWGENEIRSFVRTINGRERECRFRRFAYGRETPHIHVTVAPIAPVKLWKQVIVLKTWWIF